MNITLSSSRRYRFNPQRKQNVDLIPSVLDRDVSPDHGKDTSCQSHPDNTDGTGNTCCVFSKVKLCQQEAEGGRLHRSFNRHGTGGHFRKSTETGKEISDKTTNQVQKKDRDLQRPSGIDDGIRDLGDSTGDEETSGDDTNNRGKREDLLDEFGEEFVGTHTNRNGSQNNLIIYYYITDHG
jgi:hypothetical protein